MDASLPSVPRFDHVPRSLPRAALSSLGSALYTAKQVGVAAFLGPASALLHAVTGSPEPKRSRKLFALLEALHTDALTQDYANAEAGLYPMSLIMPLPGWHDVRFLPEALLDVPRVAWRKRRGDFHVDVPPPEAQPETPVPLPDYYRRAFHWQTDGWMSAHSARLYELQVEVLFSGTMDIMRRRGLAALVRALGGDRRRMRVRVLDVACGTGRFVEQMRAALPEATLEAVDLSPYYVERARQRLKKENATRFRVANAESLGGEDGVYDAVTCSFLFHELPKDARRRVASELFRVLEPGGVLMAQDSRQAADPGSDLLTEILDWFPKAYHEPYYKGYVQDELGAMLEEVGFVVEARDNVLMSKVVVGRKPL